MPKLLLVLAMVLVQVQPWLAALPCNRDSMSAAGSHADSGGHHTAPTGIHVTASQVDDCPTMIACAATAPAVVQVVSVAVGIRPSSRGDLPLLTTYPTQAFLVPPFHPPSV